MKPPRLRLTIRWFMVAIAVVAGLSLGVRAILRKPPLPAPVPTYTFRFGTMPQRASGRHAWQLTNTGRAPLKVFARCWTVGQLRGLVNGRDGFVNGGAVTIAPGGKAQIVQEWETRDVVGAFRQYAEIGTDDPKTPSLIFDIIGDVSGPGQVDSKRVE